MTILQVKNKKVKQENFKREKERNTPVLRQNSINWFRKLKPQGSVNF